MAQVVQPNVGQPGFREERLEMPPDQGSVVERLAGPCCEDQVWVFARGIGLASSCDLAFAVTDVLGSLLAAWYAVFGQREVQLKDVEDVVSSAEIPDPIIGGEHGGAPEKDTGFALAEARRAALETVAGRYDQERARLGMYLAKHEGRIVGGLKLVKGGKRGGARKWRVAKVAESPASNGESEMPSVEDLI